jgi:hypothetical protein
MAAHSTLPRLLAAVLILAMVPAIFRLAAEERATPAATPGKQLLADNFSSTLAQWVVEQQPGGTVTIKTGRLVIDDVGGCTIWFRPKLTAPVVIAYTATVAAKPRTSDLNCFWMATDPARPGDLFAPGHQRDGRLATYDSLRTYYVGYGGNDNTTTRFRRYPGDGSRPLLPEHDLKAPAVLLKPGHAYKIALVVIDGRVQFLRDGEVIFDYPDPQPLTEGWFGFRTVQSRIEIRDFAVREAKPVVQQNRTGLPAQRASPRSRFHPRRAGPS